MVGRADVEGALTGSRGLEETVCGDAGGELADVVLAKVGAATEE